MNFKRLLPISRRLIANLPKYKPKEYDARLGNRPDPALKETFLAGLPGGPNENQHVSRVSNNRNPRNLEKLGLERRDYGWGRQKIENVDTTDSQSTVDRHYKPYSTYPQRNCYYSIHLDFTNTRTTAVIEHTNTQQVMISASTKEWNIARRLFSLRDTTAAFNIGRVLADRAISLGRKINVFQRASGK